MNLDSLINVAALIIAILAIVPRARRLQIGLFFDLFAWSIAIIAFLSIVYLQFYQTFKTLGYTPGLNFARWAITASNASFIILLFALLSLWIYISVRNLSFRNIIKFREIVLELSSQKKYAELFFMIEKNLNQLNRLYVKADNASANAIIEFLKQKDNTIIDSLKLRLSNVIESNIKPIILPAYQKTKLVPAEIMHEILLNRNTVQALSKIRPYNAIALLSKDFNENKEFIDTYLRCLIIDHESVLYHEIRNNQNLGTGGYELPENNKLLNFLFKDCNVAKKYAVYSPIGKSVLENLEELENDKAKDIYNQPMGNFQEEGRWKSRIFVGINFIDIMISCALSQGVKSHLWLFYFPRFVEQILANLSPAKNVDLTSEWPTKYHYIIYEIVESLCKWISESPDDQRIIESTEATYQNDSIPKSSMLALGQIISMLLMSDSITDKFKCYILEQVFDSLFYLQEHNKENNQYAEALFNAIKSGELHQSDKLNSNKQLLVAYINKLDQAPYKLEFYNAIKAKLLEDMEDKVVK